MNLIESALKPIRKYPVKSGFVIGIVIGLCMFYPDQSSAIATWIGMVGGIFVIYQGLKEFEYSRKKLLKIIINNPYKVSYLDRGEPIPDVWNFDFLSGSFINAGLRKIVLVDGEIGTMNEEFYKSGVKYNPDRAVFSGVSLKLDFKNEGGIKIDFPLELEPDSVQNFKIKREGSLDDSFLQTEKVKYFVLWLKEASGEIFYTVMETPYYHDKDADNKNNVIIFP